MPWPGCSRSRVRAAAYWRSSPQFHCWAACSASSARTKWKARAGASVARRLTSTAGDGGGRTATRSRSAPPTQWLRPVPASAGVCRTTASRPSTAAHASVIPPVGSARRAMPRPASVSPIHSSKGMPVAAWARSARQMVPAHAMTRVARSAAPVPAVANAPTPAPAPGAAMGSPASRGPRTMPVGTAGSRVWCAPGRRSASTTETMRTSARASRTARGRRVVTMAAAAHAARVVEPCRRAPLASVHALLTARLVADSAYRKCVEGVVPSVDAIVPVPRVSCVFQVRCVLPRRCTVMCLRGGSIVKRRARTGAMSHRAQPGRF